MVEARKRELAMNTIQSPYQFQTLLGTGYVQEQHAYDALPSLLACEKERREFHFSDMLQRLRSALGIRR